MIDTTKFKAYTPSGRRNDIAEVLSLSGGRSSAYALIMLMNRGFGKRLNDFVSFQNTGEEDETCLLFVNQLANELGIAITWLEYSLSNIFINELIWSSFSYEKFKDCEYTNIGQILNVKKLLSFDFKKASSNFWYKDGFNDNIERIREVNFDTASRNGKPFTDVFLYKCAIRIMKGKGLILPNVGQRWCTGDMKTKLLKQWLNNKGIVQYVNYLGMRFDEPQRVNRLFAANALDRNVFFDCPLHWEGITKKDVLDAWINQGVDLGLHEGINTFRDFLGNCRFCHLKSKLKKMYLIQQGYETGLFKQIETIVNNYNEDTDAMSRQHGTYSNMEIEAKAHAPISINEVLSDSEKEMACMGCGD